MSSASSEEASDCETSEKQSTTTEVALDSPQRYVQSGIVTLYVGKKRRRFDLHKDLLRAKSEYFRAMFSDSGNWEEGKSNEIYWDDQKDGVTVEAVQIWVNWLYGTTISIHTRRQTLLECYKLGDQRMMLGFKNDVIDTFRAMHAGGSDTIELGTARESMNLRLEHTPMHQCILESLVSDIHEVPDIWSCEEEQCRWMSEATQYPTLLWQIMIESFRYRAAPYDDPHDREGCHFHDHSDGSVCEVEIEDRT